MKKYIAVVLTVILSELSGIVLHELSHLITLIAFNGTATGLSFGTTSMVEGYVSYEAIPYIAMAPFVLPTVLLLISLILKRIRRHFHINLFMLGLSIATVRVTLINLIALCINPVDVKTRATWDLILAVDSNRSIEYVFVCVSILCIVLSSYVSCRYIKSILEN